MMPESKNKPLIMVTGPARPFPTAWWATRLLTRLCGMRAVYSTPTRPLPRDDVQGIIIGGGSDISPNHYGLEAQLHGRYDPDRDMFEMHMLEQALKADIPILGICRGAQLLNVVLGGTLLQDIRPMRQHTPNTWTILPVKDALTEPDTMIRRCLDQPRARINSMHTQAIDRVAPPLVVSARDRDGFVQTVEMPTRRFVVGVQWHPEYLPYLSAQRRLMRAFANAARATPQHLH